MTGIDAEDRAVPASQPIAPGGCIANGEWRQTDARFLHEEYEVILCADIAIERHRREAQCRSDARHRDCRKSVGVRDSHRRVDDPLETELPFGAALRVRGDSPRER